MTTIKTKTNTTNNTTTIPKQYKHEYVSCLPESLETTIMNKIRSAVANLHLTESEKTDAIENANNSKVCDLTDTIRIKFA